MLKISSVEKNSPFYKKGIKPGDEIIKINGYQTRDILDYIYAESEESFTLTICRGQKLVDIEIENYDLEPLGAEFVDDGLDTMTCRNKCVFCFVDQMPKGFRKSLYVKDDDYRHSFLSGNYVTLTNIDEFDLERILRLHLSPLYISVHATDGAVRNEMTGNRFAYKILDYLKKFNQAQIQMHAQVVLVKGLNDGEILLKTFNELIELENLLTLAVVPCGITEHRNGLYKIDDITKEYALEIINLCESFNKKVNKNFAFAADEFYIRAGKDLPPAEFYGDFCQIENGVGMMRAYELDFDAVAEKREYERTYLLITGTSAKQFMEKMAKKLEGYCKGLKVFVKAVENKTFGKTVTCAGLVCGKDILEFLSGVELLYDEICIPSSMLKCDEDVFLDGVTLKELQKQSGKRVRVVGSGGELFEKLSKDE